MSNYTKLFTSLLDSTVWQEPDPVRILWITMLAMKDRDGVVEASIPGLARRAGISLQAVEDGLAKFLGPDPYSRTKDHDGRRIEVRDGGWFVLNHDKYNEKSSADEYRAKAAARQARLREARKSSGAAHSNVTSDVTVTQGHAESRSVTPSASDPTLTLLPERGEREAAPTGARPSVQSISRKPKAEPSESEMASAVVVVATLNEVTGVDYRVKTHAGLIAARLRDGYTTSDLCAVARYCGIRLGWKLDAKMVDYLRPSTLYGPRSITKYVDQARAWEASGCPPGAASQGSPRPLQLVAAPYRPPSTKL